MQQCIAHIANINKHGVAMVTSMLLEGFEAAKAGITAATTPWVAAGCPRVDGSLVKDVQDSLGALWSEVKVHEIDTTDLVTACCVGITAGLTLVFKIPS